MNPVPASVNAPGAAQVNLLPPEIAAKRNEGRAKVLMVASLMVFVLLLGAAWFFAYSARTSAEQDLADEQALRPELTTELATYDYVKVVEAQKDNSILARQWAGSSDIIWGDYTAALLKVVPDDVTLTDILMAQGTPFGPAGSDGTIFGLSDMGSLSFTGRAASPELVADFVDAVNSVPGFYDTFIEVSKVGTSDTTEYWEYAGSVRVSFSALSDRTVTTQTTAPVREDADVATDEESN